MAELGSGSTPRSDYPGAIDINTVTEVDSPSASKTLITAAKIEDAYAAIINIETELGTDPAGSKTDVKTYLQTEHNADGTHTSTGTGSIVRSASPTLTGTVAGTATIGGSIVVPLARMKVGEQSAKNAGAITVGAGGTLVTTAPDIEVVVGDRVIVTGFVNMLKGATAGLSRIYIAQTAIGGYAGTFLHDYTQLNSTATNHPNGTTYQFAVSGMLKITGTGTMRLLLYGLSGGSDGTVAIGDGQIHALVLRGV